MKPAAAGVLLIGLAPASLFMILASDNAAAQGDGYDRRMLIVNETAGVIGAFHATNTGVPVWGRDILIEDIYPGERHIIDFNDGTGYCMFDLKAVFDDGRTAERFHVNVCDAGSWTIR